jgi:hypothetical protein
MALQETVAVPDSNTLGGTIELQINPKDGMPVIVTEPKKELIAFTTIMEMAD